MNSRDRVLRAAVFEAFDARDSDTFTIKCRKVVDVDTLWPLVAANRELDRARREIAVRKTRNAELVTLLRSTYPAEVADAA